MAQTQTQCIVNIDINVNHGCILLENNNTYARACSVLSIYLFNYQTKTQTVVLTSKVNIEFYNLLTDTGASFTFSNLSMD